MDGTETLYESDSVIISISQGPQNRLVSNTNGLKSNARGLLEADETGHTSRPGIFASGDVVNGARTVVELHTAKLLQNQCMNICKVFQKMKVSKTLQPDKV